MSEIVYYYCSSKTFKSLLASHSLWLTNLTESNDQQEVSRTYDILWNKIKEHLLKSDLDPTLLNGQVELLNSTLKIQQLCDIPYGCCFCEKSDLVQQWNEYADFGDGVSIGIDLEWFGIPKQMPITSTEILHSIGYEKVIYDLPHYSSLFANLIYDAIKTKGPAAWCMYILPTFKHYAGFIKNPAFEDEKETRIVYYPDETHHPFKGLGKYVDTPKGHYPLKWSDDNSNAFVSITRGNCCMYSIEQLREMLVHEGLDNTLPIIQSECSYRKR